MLPASFSGREGDLDDVAAVGWGITPAAFTRVEDILNVAGFVFMPFSDVRSFTIAICNLFKANKELVANAGLVLNKDDLFKITDVSKNLTTQSWRNDAVAGASAITFRYFADSRSGSLSSLAEFFQLVGTFGLHRTSNNFRSITTALLAATGGVGANSDYSTAYFSSVTF